MEKFEEIVILVGEDKATLRIDKVIASHPLIVSRTQAAYLIENGNVKVKGIPVKASYKTSLGDKIQILLPLKKESELIPYDFPLEILYEDQDLLVVNKPSNLVVHPSLGHQEKTLVNALLYHTKDLSMGFGENRPGIVHRLDKETSGLLVVAKNNKSHENLSQQFKKRTIHRKYLALCFGHLKSNQARLETFIARDPKDRKKFSTLVHTGKKAITHYNLLKATDYFSLLEVKLETGRTHQIRAHLSDLGHPILGDNLYGAQKKISFVKNQKIRSSLAELKRIALHAKELGFTHPVTNKLLFFECRIPHDLHPIFLLSGLDEFAN